MLDIEVKAVLPDNSREFCSGDIVEWEQPVIQQFGGGDGACPLLPDTIPIYPPALFDISPGSMVAAKGHTAPRQRPSSSLT